jgi:RNA recognition motif-containing protein
MFKIFVGNLDYKVRTEQVRELFALYAPIEDLVIPTDPKTNKPRGFAIVMIRDPELGAAAIRGVQGKRLMGRELVVNEAHKKGKAPPVEPEPVRNGPFGPRMFRKGETRGRGNRNPRRSAGPSAPPRGTGGASPAPPVRPSIAPQVRPPAAPPRSAPAASGSTSPPSALSKPEGDRSHEEPKVPSQKARPKSSPPGP